jgi:cysteine-rich CWC protein
MTRVLPVIAGILFPRLRRSLICESCGNEFTCGASLSGCWCAEIKLTDENRAKLRERFSDCLCQNCLERIASEQANYISAQKGSNGKKEE